MNIKVFLKNGETKNYGLIESVIRKKNLIVFKNELDDTVVFLESNKVSKIEMEEI